MVPRLLKRFAARFPDAWQYELRRWYFRRQIARDVFATDEREYALLDRFLRPGDWALDIGANIGHYAKRMSDLVGAKGRVIALEPVPVTFALLAANARAFRHANVSLLNVAASDSTATAGVSIPDFTEGLRNYYQASLADGSSDLTVLTLAVDALALSQPVRLAKIDVEGHELPVLRGMQALLVRDQPTLIVETSSREVMDLLTSLGYSTERLAGSSNLLCTPRRTATAASMTAPSEA
jgi:FkbM family methyltransferase